MRALRFIIALLMAMPALGSTLPGSPATTNNDDSCDISLLPAATLLLPYFEVDFNSPAQTAKTTLFSVQNVTNAPQIARVTLWTDWAYPLLSFNLFLTGYDVQPINLYDVIARGVIAPASTGGVFGTGPNNTERTGERSLPNDANSHFLPSAATSCAQNPGPIPAPLLAELRLALTTGRAATICDGANVGGVHGNAVGYATIDLVATCGLSSPASPAFYGELLFDNVLGGEYQVINPNPATGNYAGGNPLVHIRAIPEGGNAGDSVPTNLPYTFYDRFTGSLAQRTFDRRQPLPSAFSARFIQGGTTGFNTELRIWREGVANECGKYQRNGTMDVLEIVRFDEHENPTVATCNIELCPPPPLPATASVATSSSLFPPLSTETGDLGGWLYINLDNGGALAYSAERAPFYHPSTIGQRGSQNWIVMSMFAEGRYAVELDALPLGNGCSPSPDVGATIGPAPNRNP